VIKTIRFRNDNISFSDEGKGRAVVLLHGFLGSSAIWQPVTEALKNSYRVIAIDLPGHGNSACYGYVHTMELMAGAVKAVIDSLKIKKCVLIGHSMGGYVALAFADMFPDSLKGLCLYHSTAYADTDEKKKDRLRAIEIVRSDKNLYTKSTVRNLFAAKNLKYLKKELSFAAAIAKRTSKRGIVASLRGMRDRPARDIILGVVEYPIMMVIGEHDNVIAPAQLLEQSENIKNLTLLYLEHDGHFGFLESPAASNKALRKFIRKCFYPVSASRLQKERSR
jgi:pimeloyl-ACP methyl ester carboxylesterase